MPLVLRGDTIHQHIDSQEGYVWGLPPSLSTRIGKVPVISYRIGKVKVKVSDRN